MLVEQVYKQNGPLVFICSHVPAWTLLENTEVHVSGKSKNQNILKVVFKATGTASVDHFYAKIYIYLILSYKFIKIYLAPGLFRPKPMESLIVFRQGQIDVVHSLKLVQ